MKILAVGDLVGESGVKKLKEVLQNWGLENEKLMDVVYAETGNISDSACYVGENYIIKFLANLGNVKKHILRNIVYQRA